MDISLRDFCKSPQAYLKDLPFNLISKGDIVAVVSADKVPTSKQVADKPTPVMPTAKAQKTRAETIVPTNPFDLCKQHKIYRISCGCA